MPLPTRPQRYCDPASLVIPKHYVSKLNECELLFLLLKLKGDRDAMTLSEVNLSGYCLCELAAGVWKPGKCESSFLPKGEKRKTKENKSIRRASVIECLKVKSIENESSNFFGEFFPQNYIAIRGEKY